MKYILGLLIASFSAFSLCHAANEQLKAQSVLEYCSTNPNHKNCKLIKKIFKELKPRSKIVRIWRLIIGKGMFLPDDHLRHYLNMCSEEIGEELNWSKEKIHDEFNKLYEEAVRIRNS